MEQQIKYHNYHHYCNLTCFYLFVMIWQFLLDIITINPYYEKLFTDRQFCANKLLKK